MAEAIALPAGATEKLVTGASAFGTGMGMSFVTKTWPALGIMGNIMICGTGLMGALFTKGLLADFFEGVGAGGAAILGSTIAWLPGGGGAQTVTKEITKGGQKIELQLKGGPAARTAELAAKTAMATLEF
ncbi:hypothetical protein ES703_06361 [subsurface metagenome]